MTHVFLNSSSSSVLESTRRSSLPLGRFSTSYLLQGEFFDRSVILEASWALTDWGMRLPLVKTRSAQVAFVAVDIQHRYTMGQLTFSTDAQWSSWHDPELACFWAVSGDNWLGLLCLVSLVPLGVRTTCLGTLDPLNYRHFMLHVVRHKNVYNSCPLKYEAVLSGEMLYQEDPKFIQRWGETCNKIQYNTLSFILLSWSRWGGHSHAQLYKFILVHRTNSRLMVDW